MFLAQAVSKKRHEHLGPRINAQALMPER